MSKPIVVIWLKGVNLIQENTLHKYNANTIRQLPATNHKQYKRKPMPLFPPIVWF